MSAKNLMLIGVLVSFVSALGYMVIGPSGAFMILAFAGGAVFGKGCGIWEVLSDDQACRHRSPPHDPEPTP